MTIQNVSTNIPVYDYSTIWDEVRALIPEEYEIGEKKFIETKPRGTSWWEKPVDFLQIDKGNEAVPNLYKGQMNTGMILQLVQEKHDMDALASLAIACFLMDYDVDLKEIWEDNPGVFRSLQRVLEMAKDDLRKSGYPTWHNHSSYYFLWAETYDFIVPCKRYNITEAMNLIDSNCKIAEVIARSFFDAFGKYKIVCSE